MWQRMGEDALLQIVCCIMENSQEKMSVHTIGASDNDTVLVSIHETCIEQVVPHTVHELMPTVCDCRHHCFLAKCSHVLLLEVIRQLRRAIN